MRRSSIWGRVFDAIYASSGRPSIAPEKLLRALLLQMLYTVRSERLFCEQLDYNLLFRWFLDMDIVEESFVPTVFTKNRNRLIAHDVAREFLLAVVAQARAAKLMSNDHFTVDGTLIESWASLKSFKKKDDDDTTPPDDPGNPTVNFHRGKAEQRDARIDNGPGRDARAQGPGQGGKALVLRARADGESQRPRSPRLRDPGHRPRRTAGGHGAG